MNDVGRAIILVTGATGTVGSEVVKQLVSCISSPSSSSGQSVIRAAVHSQNKADKFSQYGDETVEIVYMDYNKPETIAAALNNASKLFLLTLPSLNMTVISSKVVSEPKTPCRLPDSTIKENTISYVF